MVVHLMREVELVAKEYVIPITLQEGGCLVAPSTNYTELIVVEMSG